MRPVMSYLICGTPRSGSSLLCEALENTGLAGRPKEYFWRENIAVWSELWDIQSSTEYIEKTIDLGSTPNGVFGAKVMWSYFYDLVDICRQSLRCKASLVPELLQEFFPNLNQIF